MYQQQPNGGGGINGALKDATGAGPVVANEPLENRLRNMLIQSTADSNSSNYHAGSPSSTHVSMNTPPSTMLHTPRSAPSGNGFAEASSQTGQAPELPRYGRKRLNQAQRRQMSAQLSIPIDLRQVSSPSVGNFTSPPPLGNHQQPFRQAFPHQQSQYHNTRGYHHQQTTQWPQSAAHRPAHNGHGIHPLTNQANGSSYLSQSRHQHSQSYHGPTSYNDPHNWRSFQGHSQGTGAPPIDAPLPRGGRYHNHQEGSVYAANQGLQVQSAFLDRLCSQIVSSAEIEASEIQNKELFRARIERLCQEALAQYEHETNGRANFPPESVRLRCFGSLASGLATKSSDMDLGIISPFSVPLPDAPKSPIPRLIEKAFLDAGLGARLISRTRVPIIKLCEKPSEQLRLSLLEERAKWEHSLLENDSPHGDDEAIEETDIPPTQVSVEETALDGDKQHHARNDSILDGDQLDEDKYKQILAHLKQVDKQKVPAYFSAAKRTLRKLGCRDVTYATMREYKDNDLKTLTDVCHAFVQGLSDPELKGRLLATRSLASSGTPDHTTYRSLCGVVLQVEGEQLAMLWEKREIREKDRQHEEEAAAKIRAWRALQDKSNFAQDLLGYNKELRLAVDDLRKIVSLQIMTLEQGSLESPTQYHDRAEKLLFYCGARDSGGSATGNETLAVLIKQYIAGINNHDIRTEVDSFAQSINSSSLRNVARRHKSLHLALEFERALAKKCYDSTSADDVKAYIDVLRLPLQKCDHLGRPFEYVVARTPETAAVISRARQFGYPSSLAPNQPRDPYRDRFEFPKMGTGVQCDINFAAHLGLQNTLLLRCYSHTDPRVRPLVLFVKHWAKMRDINTPYRGTLGSYGYVLMMLHYLVNVAQPFVCPNLQQLARPIPEGISPEEYEETVSCRGHNVRFWRDEEEIKSLAARGLLTQNKDSVGHLLRGFFEYYAQKNYMSTVACRGFDWGREVLSLRTPGGLRAKKEKGWTGARTVLEVQNQVMKRPGMEAMATTEANGPGPGTNNGASGPPLAVEQPLSQKQDASSTEAPAPEMKEVKHRFLFAIEDPFELEHNVARTVTHSGIVAIRDEFRRAWRIICNMNNVEDEDLLADATDHKDNEKDVFAELLNEIHGPELSP